MGFYILSKNIQSPVAFQMRNKLIDFCQIDQKTNKDSRLAKTMQEEQLFLL